MHTLEDIHLTLTLARSGPGFTVAVSGAQMARDMQRTVFSDASTAIFAGCEALSRDPFAELAVVFYDGRYAAVNLRAPCPFERLDWRSLSAEAVA